MTRNKHQKNALSRPEWSYPFQADQLGNSTERLTISPKPDELQALRQRLNVTDVQDVSARLELSRIEGGRVIHVKGRFQAVVTQPCVVTLEPVTTQLADDCESWHADPNDAVSFVKAKIEREAKTKSEDVPVLEEKDDPEPILNGEIDLGELVTQFLILAIDPYPRKDGVVFEDIREDDERQNPFSILKS